MKGSWKEGDLVLGRWSVDKRWYDGEISRVHSDGTYDIWWPKWKNNSNYVTTDDIKDPSERRRSRSRSRRKRRRSKSRGSRRKRSRSRHRSRSRKKKRSRSRSKKKTRLRSNSKDKKPDVAAPGKDSARPKGSRSQSRKPKERGASFSAGQRREEKNKADNPDGRSRDQSRRSSSRGRRDAGRLVVRKCDNNEEAWAATVKDNSQGRTTTFEPPKLYTAKDYGIADSYKWRADMGCFHDDAFGSFFCVQRMKYYFNRTFHDWDEEKKQYVPVADPLAPKVPPMAPGAAAGLAGLFPGLGAALGGLGAGLARGGLSAMPGPSGLGAAGLANPALLGGLASNPYAALAGNMTGLGGLGGVAAGLGGLGAGVSPRGLMPGAMGSMGSMGSMGMGAMAGMGRGGVPSMGRGGGRGAALPDRRSRPRRGEWVSHNVPRHPATGRSPRPIPPKLPKPKKLKDFLGPAAARVGNERLIALGHSPRPSQRPSQGGRPSGFNPNNIPLGPGPVWENGGTSTGAGRGLVGQSPSNTGMMGR